MSRLQALGALLISLTTIGLAWTAPATATDDSHAALIVNSDRFDPYVPRNGHERPLVAVIGHNDGTELTDFVIPYAVLQRSCAVDTVAVSTRPGPMKMRPALLLQPHADIGSFDERNPEGADYVIVPAIEHRDDPALLAWIRAQHDKGATIVSICDGALVVANAGLLSGHRATAHWATEDHRREHYPDTLWIANARYVVDGRVASSAGISAAIPTALALLESIAGPGVAGQVGAEFGVRDWSAAHDSDRFHVRLGNIRPLAAVMVTNAWFHAEEQLAIALRPGMDDVALALTADAYSRTGRSRAYGVTEESTVRSRAGLDWLPDDKHPDDVKHPLEPATASPDEPIFDAVLASVDRRYGHTTARGVANVFEYAWTPTGR